jgi:acyl carrier protein
MEQSVKGYILKEFLPDDSPDALELETPLITSGVLDSIATVKLVSFLEEQYGVDFQAHEVSVDYLNSIADITKTVQSKLAS